MLRSLNEYFNIDLIQLAFISHCFRNFFQFYLFLSCFLVIRWTFSIFTIIFFLFSKACDINAHKFFYASELGNWQISNLMQLLCAAAIFWSMMSDFFYRYYPKWITFNCCWSDEYLSFILIDFQFCLSPHVCQFSNFNLFSFITRPWRFSSSTLMTLSPLNAIEFPCRFRSLLSTRN